MPERPGRWDLLARPSDPIVADSAAIEEQLAHFRDLAATLRLQGERLTRIGSGESLRGAYADELRESATQVGKDLTQTVGRYEAVVSALQEYRPALDAALSGSAAALDDAVTASNAQGQADAMPVATPAEGETLTPEDEQANADRTAAVDGAAARLEEARARLTGVLSRLDEAGRAASRTVSKAFNDGLKDSHWDRFKYKLAQILKVLVIIFTVIAIVLAVAALVIPGIGPLFAGIMMTISRALDVFVVVAEVVLVGLEESSPEDIGFAILGLATLGLGSLVKVGRGAGRGAAAGATPPATRPPTPDPVPEGTPPGSRPPSPDADADGVPPASRADTPPPSRNGSPNVSGKAEEAWGVPPGSKLVDPPDDLPPGVTIKPGTQSWVSPSGAVYTRIDHFEGFRGMGTEGAKDFYANGPRRVPGFQNGSDDPNWKGLYVANTRDVARDQFGSPINNDTGQPDSGDLTKFTTNTEFTMVTPKDEIGKHDPFGNFPDVTSNGKPFMDTLGDKNIVFRNPLGPTDEDRYEWIFPWSIAPHGKITPVGRNEAVPEMRGTRPHATNKVHQWVDLDEKGDPVTSSAASTPTPTPTASGSGS